MKVATQTDWDIVTVADVAEVQGGIQKQQRRRPMQNRYPFLRVANVQRGNLNLQEIHEIELFNGELERLALRPGDLLVVEGNGNPDEVGRAAMWEGAVDKCVHQNHLIRVRPKERLNPRFFEFLWNSPAISRQLRRVARSTSGLHTLSTKKIKDIRFALPPLELQQHIVSILQEIKFLQAERLNALAALSELEGSIFVDMFGDVVTNDRSWPAGDVGKLVARFETGRSLATGHEDGPAARHRILKVSAVTTGRFLPTESKPAPPDYEPPSEHIVRDGDLLFSRANTEELIGATALVCSPPANLLMPDKLWRFVWHVGEPATSRYVRQLFRQPKFRREISRRSTGTSGSMKNIAQSKVLAISCGLPPADLRLIFDERVKSIEAVAASHEDHLAGLDALLASLLDQSFQDVAQLALGN